jgi:hypothetical protein
LFFFSYSDGQHRCKQWELQENKRPTLLFDILIFTESDIGQ